MFVITPLGSPGRNFVFAQLPEVDQQYAIPRAVRKVRRRGLRDWFHLLVAM
jgi:hypothetical protein